MSNLDAYKFTEFSTHKPTQEKFLENVEAGVSSGNIPLFAGIPGSTFPAPFPENPALSPGFYKEGDNSDSHKERFPKYHEIVFPLMETLAKTVSIPVSGPVAPPIQDPTIPIQNIISALDLDVDIDVEDILPRAPDFIDAMAAFSSDWEPLYEELIELDLPIEDKELRDFLKELQATASFDVPEVPLPDMSPPMPPFIDIPAFAIPIMSMPDYGIIDFFIGLIHAAIAAVVYVVDLILSSIPEFITVIAEGIQAIVEWLFEKVYEIIEPVLEKFSHLFAQVGWVSTIGTILKYTIGMIMVTIIVFILGPGLIAGAVAKFLGLN